MSACRYCDNGLVLRGNDHWIVKSIMPARINVVRCKDLPKAPSKPKGPDHGE